MSDDLVLPPGGYRSRARVHHIERDHYLDQKRGTRQKNLSLRSSGGRLWSPAFHPVARNRTGDLDSPDAFTVGSGQAMTQ
jgi:hypothetical protein